MGLKIETKDDLKDLILAIKECGIKGKIDVTIPDIHIVIDESGYTEKPTLNEGEKEAIENNKDKPTPSVELQQLFGGSVEEFYPNGKPKE